MTGQLEKRSCIANSAKGQPCQARPLRDGAYCFLHDPHRVEEAAEARRLGGLRRRREKTVTTTYALGGLDTLGDVRRLVQIAVLDSLALDNSSERSRLLLAAASTATKLLQLAELADQLATIDDALRRN